MLVNADLCTGLRGTGVRIDPSAFARIHSPALITENGLVSGWNDTADGITVGTPKPAPSPLYALCTSDPAEGYAPPTAA